jgi:predicted nucleic acid-binding protein
LSAVLDASVLVAALIDSGPNGTWAEAILAAGDLNAPEMLYAQTVNVIRRMESAHRISAADANAAFEDLMRLQLQLHPFEPFADRIWELRHNCTAYDAWYVAIAEALSIPLATLDARIARTKSLTCKFLTP